MEKQTKKKEWKIPELIILVRSNPEEAVLLTCKFTNVTGSYTGDCKLNGVECSGFKKS